jgi:hypothetical protein
MAALQLPEIKGLSHSAETPLAELIAAISAASSTPGHSPSQTGASVNDDRPDDSNANANDDHDDLKTQRNHTHPQNTVAHTTDIESDSDPALRSGLKMDRSSGDESRPAVVVGADATATAAGQAEPLTPTPTPASAATTTTTTTTPAPTTAAAAAPAFKLPLPTNASNNTQASFVYPQDGEGGDGQDLGFDFETLSPEILRADVSIAREFVSSLFFKILSLFFSPFVHRDTIILFVSSFPLVSCDN